jgi:transposase, IS5 family
MLTPSSNGHQTNLFGIDLLLQLDPNDPLLVLARAIPWQELERDLGCHYCPGVGRPALPIIDPAFRSFKRHI